MPQPLAAVIKLLGEMSRDLIANFRMSPSTIVEHFDIFKHDLPSLFACCKTVVMQTLALQRAEEAFHRRIVPTASFSTVTILHAACRVVDCLPLGHRRLHAIARLEQTVSRTAILAATIR
jgi:hypothetical protein